MTKGTKKRTIVRGFKGFNTDLTCLGKQYEIGKTFKENEAVLCSCGMHFCEHPLDCLHYYSVTNSQFCVVTAINPISETDEMDSKRVTTELTINNKLTLTELTEHAVAYVNKNIKKTTKRSNSGYYGAAFNCALKGQATTNAYNSIAVAVGHGATASGNLGSWLVLAERDSDWNIISIKAAEVDGSNLKANVLYMLKDGNFIESEEE